MHIHKIDNKIHSDFLKENRQDPITGDLIQEGDEVVFCASCKSAFLKDTWLYLDKKHCNQSKTLKNPIFQKNLVLVKTQKETIFIPLEDIKSFKEFSKKTKNTSWTSKYAHIKNNVQVNNEREGTNLILLMSTALYIGVMFSFTLPFGLFGLVSAPAFVLLVRYYINAVYSSNKDKAMLGVGQNEISIYFSEKKQQSFINYKQVEKITITYKSEEKSILKLKDKNGIKIKVELQTAFINKFLRSISERNKVVNVELVAFPEEYQNIKLFGALQENPLLRLI